MKTLLDDFYDRYKNTWFRRFETNKTAPMYYIIYEKKWYGFELKKYYPKTKKFYHNTTSLTMEHFKDFEIVNEDDSEYKELTMVLAKHLLIN